MRVFSFCLVILICNFWFTGCLDEEFTTNPNDRLAYSADTVRFDTVFTTLSSSTSKLMVYNPHKKAINIESIQLKNGGQSGFRINVDGMKGNYFEQIEISKNDSLYIFIEVTADPTGKDHPERYEDLLEFSYNGIRQQITLEAYGQDAIIWHGKVILTDTILTATKPFLIYDSLYIAPGKTLTLEAGTRLFMHDKTRIIVEGSLNANGQFGKPVVLRGNRTDKLFPNLAYDQMAAQWSGIRLCKESFNNRWTHTHIRGTSFGIEIDSTNMEQEKLRLENCILKNSKQELIKATHARIEAYNCEFSNAGGALLHLAGGYYRFTHCTIANFYPFGVISDATVKLSNYKYNEKGDVIPLPLQQASFNNCIIWGNRSVEVNLDSYQLAGTEPTPFVHLFNHCLIKAAGEDDENFIQTVWNKDPKFKQVNPKEYLFDFNLMPESAALKTGNPEYAQEYPYDLNGNIRSEGVPDLGAYQFVPENENPE